jgi:hypothetical protein
MPFFLTCHTKKPAKRCAQTGKFREVRHLANHKMEFFRTGFTQAQKTVDPMIEQMLNTLDDPNSGTPF